MLSLSGSQGRAQISTIKTDSKGTWWLQQLGQKYSRVYSINAMLIKFDPKRLDEGNSIEGSMKVRNAKYHESCRLQFNNTKLQTARKRSSSSAGMAAEEIVSGKVPQRASKSGDKQECFLCESEIKGGYVREAMTMKLTQRLDEYAGILGDGKLLAKLSAGDAVAQDFIYHSQCLAKLYNRFLAHERSKLQEQKTASEQKD